jgi:hypothetical protein
MSRFGKENPTEFRSNNLCSKKTKQVTSYAVRIINDFFNDRGNERFLLDLSKEELAVILEDFYDNVHTKNGELYKKNSLLSIRQALNRYFKESGKMFDVITDNEFTHANRNFSSILRYTRKERKGGTQHHSPIAVEDIQRLYNHPIVFNTSTPGGLVNKVIFEIMLYFVDVERKSTSVISKPL